MLSPRIIVRADQFVRGLQRHHFGGAGSNREVKGIAIARAPLQQHLRTRQNAWSPCLDIPAAYERASALGNLSSQPPKFRARGSVIVFICATITLLWQHEPRPRQPVTIPYNDNMKRALIDALLEHFDDEIEARKKNAEATVVGATHEEAKPENDKDTRALEATYLARGQAMRVEELQDAATRIRFIPWRDFSNEDAIDVSALVHVEIDGNPTTFFLIPDGGGRKAIANDVSVQFISPGSPLGRALVGKQIGDEFELRIAGKLREYKIIEVS